MRPLCMLALVAMLAAGCQTDRPTPPAYDTPYPIPEMLDPVSEQPVRTR